MRKMKKRAIIASIILSLTIMLFALPAQVALSYDPSFVEYNEATNTYTVSPTGEDDTENIQDALDDAVASGPGSTVELTAGEFWLSKPIQVADFDGTLRGAGKSETIVRNKEDGLFPLAEPPVGLWPYYFVFYLQTIGGSRHDSAKITVSDMTLICADITETWYITFPGSVGSFEIPFSDYNPICVFGKFKGLETRVIDGDEYQVYAGEKGYYDITIERLQVEGLDSYEHPWGWGEMSNVHNAIVVQGWLETYPVNDDTFIFYGIVPNQGKVTIVDCTVIDPQNGVSITDQDHSKITVKNNEITNSLTGVSNYYGVELGSNADSWIHIRNNEIEGFMSGICAFSSSNYGMAYRNKISASVSGVKLDGVSGWSIKFNEFYDMENAVGAGVNCTGSHNIIMMNYYRASGLPGWTEETPDGPGCVYLHDSSSENLVWEKRFPAGTTSETQVLDLGDNNHVFTPLT